MKNSIKIGVIALSIALFSSSFSFAVDDTRIVKSMDEVKENERVLSVNKKELKREFTFEIQGEPDFSKYTPSNAGAGDLKEVPKKIEKGFFTIKKITDIRSYLIGKEGGESVKKTYKGLKEKVLPTGADKITTDDGGVLTLKETTWEEVKRIKLTGKMYIEGGASPNFPKEKELKATLPDGEMITVKGKLKNIEKVSSYSKPFTLKGRYIGGSDVDGYIFKGKVIPFNEKRPVYIGYEKDILDSLGVKGDGVKITGSRWTSEYIYDEEIGDTVRYFEYTCIKKAFDYVGYYEEDLTETSPSLFAYTAKCKYDNGEATYKVHLVAVYGKTEIVLIRVILAAGVSISILSLIIVLIIYLLKKKSKEKPQN